MVLSVVKNGLENLEKHKESLKERGPMHYKSDSLTNEKFNAAGHQATLQGIVKVLSCLQVVEFQNCRVAEHHPSQSFNKLPR